MALVKTSELIRTALDWAVAKASNTELWIASGNTFPHLLRTRSTDSNRNYNPSIDWKLAGPIIEREFIATESPRAVGWQASMWSDERNPITGHHRFGAGDTLIIAAMRCYVSHKLGDTVEIPEEVLNAG